MTCHRVRSVPKPKCEYEPLAWHNHVAKKACSYVQELKSHADRGCVNCARCAVLKEKLDKLPLVQVGLDSLQGHQRVTEEDVQKAKQAAGALGNCIRRRFLEWRVEMLQSVLDVLDWDPILHPPGFQGVSAQTKDTAVNAIGMLDFEVPPLTALQLQQSAKERSQSVPGLDQVSLQELRELPLGAWTPLAQMFADIERGQQWPSQLLVLKWVPLSKERSGEAVGVEKTRLISVSSHIVRTWSTARARQATDFLAKVCPVAVQGGLPHRSTFDVLGQSSARWCIAQASRSPFCELSLDCSKCFDTLDAGALCDIAVAVNFMPGIFLAFRRFALTQHRLLTMHGWCGPSTVPTRGVPQGDGLSVVLAVLAPTAGAVAKSFGVAAVYLGSWGVQLNPQKSNVAFVRQDNVPAAMAELQQVSSFRLLGVSSGPSPSDSLLLERLTEANTRLDRIALLSPPMNMVRKLVAVFVVPVLYGCSFSLCECREWRETCNRIHAMCFGSARYAASKYMVKLVAYKAHTWHPDMYRVREAWSIIHRLGRRESTRTLFDSVIKQSAAIVCGEVSPF
eukprot:5408975-Amphidinium_carterae.1